MYRQGANVGAMIFQQKNQARRCPDKSVATDLVEGDSTIITPMKTILKTIIIIFALIGLVFTIVFIGMQFGAFNVRGANTARNISLGATATIKPVNDCLDTTVSVCTWDKTSQWNTIKTALQKDASVVQDVSTKTGVDARMIAATVIPEQLRYFTANRESFKKYFEPLKILGALSKFSLGVSGVKQETALQIERYANDPTSDFYPGDGIAALIAYPDGTNHDTELYNRLTDEHNHYYSYLYTAIYIKEIQAQWAKSGFDVSKQPEVPVTLFNIGFGASHPNATPKVAGSIITLGGKKYSFGELGTLFYNSDELTDSFAK